MMIATLIGWLTGDLWPYIAAGVAALLGAVGLYLKGRGDAKAKAAAKEARGYQETMGKAIDYEAEHSGDTADAARERMLKRNPRKP